MAPHDDHLDFVLPSGEALSVVYRASSWTEAIVVRGLLESSGIPSPALGDGYPPDIAPLYSAIEIYALESQAEAAIKVITEYLQSPDALKQLGEDESEIS